MKRLTLKNLDRAKAIVKKLAPNYSDEKAENVALNAFAIAQNFGITVEEALRNFEG